MCNLKLSHDFSVASGTQRNIILLKLDALLTNLAAAANLTCTFFKENYDETLPAYERYSRIDLR